MVIGVPSLVLRCRFLGGRIFSLNFEFSCGKRSEQKQQQKPNTGVLRCAQDDDVEQVTAKAKAKASAKANARAKARKARTMAKAR